MHHPSEYQAVRPGKGKSSKAREGTIPESFRAATKLRSDSREHKQIKKEITCYPAMDMLPMYSVEMVLCIRGPATVCLVETISVIPPSLPFILRSQCSRLSAEPRRPTALSTPVRPSIIHAHGARI